VRLRDTLGAKVLILTSAPEKKSLDFCFWSRSFYPYFFKDKNKEGKSKNKNESEAPPESSGLSFYLY
jgi:hypothetical protein